MPDASVDLLTEAILAREQPRTAGLFFQMVRHDGRSLGEALGAVTAAEAPFVQVPSHLTSNSWMRTSDNPYQPRVLYLMAHFVNDAARANQLFTSVRERECAGVDVSGRSPQTLLRDHLLLAAARLLAGWPKMPGERDCFARFTREWR